jgi:hypothetical protein
MKVMKDDEGHEGMRQFAVRTLRRRACVARLEMRTAG